MSQFQGKLSYLDLDEMRNISKFIPFMLTTTGISD